MYMIVCDVEGCDTVEKHSDGSHHNIGFNFPQLPPGWRTVQMSVPPSAEETAAIEQQQADFKAMYQSIRDDNPSMAVPIEDVTPVWPERLSTFVVCPKHEMPSMKPEAAKEHHSMLPMGAQVMGRMPSQPFRRATKKH